MPCGWLLWFPRHLYAAALHRLPYGLASADAGPLRLAPEAKDLRLLTGIIMLPYHNPVDIAEQTVTMDQISNGRFTLGLGLGYREKELEAFGTNRRDRASRLRGVADSYEDALDWRRCHIRG